MSEDEDEWIVIKNKPIDKLDPSDPENVKKIVEYFNLWYLFECYHCETLFLVEDSIDNTGGDRKNIELFHAHCPRCGSANPSEGHNLKRLKLRVKGFAKQNEFPAFDTEAAKKMKLPKEVEEKMAEIKEINRAEKNWMNRKSRKKKKP